ncbi:MAG TPA: hypothetical protein DEP42_02695 [Ruminococcaceae bacterium]|nr:hypothetical protein [Oscillospiraceae bacterium]
MWKSNLETNEDWHEWVDTRLDTLEKEYESEYITDLDFAKLNKLQAQLQSLLGVQNRDLLQDYTDKLIALYNRDSDWFYKKGWQDATNLAHDIPRDT